MGRRSSAKESRISSSTHSTNTDSVLSERISRVQRLSLGTKFHYVVISDAVSFNLNRLKKLRIYSHLSPFFHDTCHFKANICFPFSWNLIIIPRTLRESRQRKKKKKRKRKTSSWRNCKCCLSHVAWKSTRRIYTRVLPRCFAYLSLGLNSRSQASRVSSKDYRSFFLSRRIPLFSTT